MQLKILKIFGIFILILVFSLSIYIFGTGPKLPENTDEIIEAAMLDSLPELLTGTTGIAQSQGLDIWYESKIPRDTAKGTILLIMGISNDALAWPPKFLDALVDSGFQVVRYDHRGTGMSDWLADWKASNPYSLSDMAIDGIAVLDKLGIQKAHIFGISMGGMIAQELAINHPERVHTLCSVMSSGFIEDPELPKISANIALQLIKSAIKYSILRGTENMVKLHIASRMILRGNASYHFNTKEIAEQVLYNIQKRKGYNSNVSKQHQAAVSISGSRYDKLSLLPIRTLVVHGKSDPFIPIEHSMKYLRLLPNADSLWIDNMGHDLPDQHITQLVTKIIGHLKPN